MIKFKLSFMMFVNSLMHASGNNNEQTPSEAVWRELIITLPFSPQNHEARRNRREARCRPPERFVVRRMPSTKQAAATRFWQHAASGFFEPSGGECGGCPFSPLGALLSSDI
jgi:hypothetical protein